MRGEQKTSILQRVRVKCVRKGGGRERGREGGRGGEGGREGGREGRREEGGREGGREGAKITADCEAHLVIYSSSAP